MDSSASPCRKAAWTNTPGMDSKAVSRTRLARAWAPATLCGFMLFYGLVVATQSAFRPRGAECVEDSECGSGTFCDRDACVPLQSPVFTPRAFGAACDRDEVCGGYLCIAERCRSCAAEDECLQAS